MKRSIFDSVYRLVLIALALLFTGKTALAQRDMSFPIDNITNSLQGFAAVSGAAVAAPGAVAVRRPTPPPGPFVFRKADQLPPDLFGLQVGGSYFSTSVRPAPGVKFDFDVWVANPLVFYSPPEWLLGDVIDLYLALPVLVVDFTNPNLDTTSGLGQIDLGSQILICNKDRGLFEALRGVCKNRFFGDRLALTFVPEVFFPSPDPNDSGQPDSYSLAGRGVIDYTIGSASDLKGPPGELGQLRALLDVGYRYNFDRASLTHFEWKAGLAQDIGMSNQATIGLGFGGLVPQGGDEVDTQADFIVSLNYVLTRNLFPAGYGTLILRGFATVPVAGTNGRPDAIGTLALEFWPF